jgi:hypothetical protein
MLRRIGSVALRSFEILVLCALILATHFANSPDVLVAGNVYFTDADCYARMTRVRMCAQHPGLIVRHQSFENFPQGTTPHTTAPLDYLILLLSFALAPVTDRALDIAGALISPLFALLGGWFLWWWARRMKFRYRWTLLLLYAISPILVHGSELGRPDHQSLAMLLVTVAICAEWSLLANPAGYWNEVSGATWGLAIWVSGYEPLILFLLVVACRVAFGRGNRRRPVSDSEEAAHPPWLRSGAARSAATRASWQTHRRLGWILFFGILLLALAVERRIPSFAVFRSTGLFRNWLRTIGELAHVRPLDPIWFRWAGYLLAVAPILAVLAMFSAKPAGAGRDNRSAPPFLLLLSLATYLLTIWQARWAYFFLSIFAIALPGLLQRFKWKPVVWVVFAISLWPVLRSWDDRLWPNESEFAERIQHRNELVQLRDLALTIRSRNVAPFLAPWWLSPAISYWSGQPGVAGSSHESLPGIVASAHFFLATDWQKAREILSARQVQWVFAYDADRVAQNSAAIPGEPVPVRPLCRVIDRTPSQGPDDLVLAAQNGAGKLLRVANGPNGARKTGQFPLGFR